MADFLDEKRREMQERLKELRPLVDEFHRLEAAVAALDGVNPSGTATPSRRRGGGGSGGGSGSSGGGGDEGNGRRGRPRGSGTRGKQALEAVRANPGITIPEIAEQMGIQQNYLYRVLPGLQKDGLIRKEGRGWHPMEAA
ncbi:MAG: Rrf2 family transcriptional regulator [Conexibacter sp.]|jgi:CRP-like cAMP-binding protein|nr:Rrf2 family transcriptional regulator [Conexibacter sp.]